MFQVKVCVGSSCHLKGSPEIVVLLQNAIEMYNIKEDVQLIGSFCNGSCNREGVTLIVDDKIFTGVTVNNFNEFFKQNILNKVRK